MNCFLGSRGVDPILVWRHVEGIQRATYPSGLFSGHMVT